MVRWGQAGRISLQILDFVLTIARNNSRKVRADHKLASAGSAIVSIPDWFEALNRDFRYQLTVIDQFAQAIVGSEMTNHSFTIRTDKPNVKVSWQVTGIRQDAYANAHRIPVEEAKPEKERGLYLHPELFGAPVEKSIAAGRHPGAMKLVNQGSAKLTDSTMHQAIKQ